MYLRSSIYTLDLYIYLHIRTHRHICLQDSYHLHTCEEVVLLADWSHKKNSPLTYPWSAFPQVSTVTTIYLLVSPPPSDSPYAQQVNSPASQGKPKPPDFQACAQSCSWSIWYLCAGLGKGTPLQTLNCRMLKNCHDAQFLRE